MLNRLSVHNYTIIESLEIIFSDKMNIITGETGAGKSVLLGALSLILGERADTKALYNQEDKCIIEAEFKLTGSKWKGFFEEHELDFERSTTLRREITPAGKSRAFINDTPVNLNVLKDLGERLVNLHSQHETLDLVKAGFQLQIIDSIAGNKELLENYRQQFYQYQQDSQRLRELTDKWKISSAELDYLQFQLKELAELKLLQGEDALLETEQNTLSHVEQIKLTLASCNQFLSEGDTTILDQLNEVQNLLRTVKGFNPEVLSLSQRLHSAYEEVKDISLELASIQENLALDPDRLGEINARLDAIYRLQKKHQVKTAGGLIEIQKGIEQKIQAVDNSSADLDKLRTNLAAELNELQLKAGQLHAAREKVLRDFQTHVTVLLTRVGMPNASFKVDIQKHENQLNENGFSSIKFLFSANKGFAAQEIKEVASGGELSRLMLCIKSLVANSDDLPTLIFDEIDAGISGEVALKVSEIMRRLAQNRQVVCITHLPQIARTANKHLYVYKENKDRKTQTHIRELNEEERIVEIAKMISGNKLSPASLANAREMIVS
jgi:DNA repair protein RecN (Recombination protein N)